MAAYPPYPLVIVEWVDSIGCASDWESLDELDPTLPVCQSVGWLVHEDKRAIVVVPHLTPPRGEGGKRDGCGDMAIPAVAVLSIKRLNVGKAYKRKAGKAK